MEQLEIQALTLSERANQIVVTNREQRSEATAFLKNVKALKEKISEDFRPIIKDAHSTWKLAIEKEKKHLNPLEAAERVVKLAVGQYDAQEERRLDEERRRLEAESRKREEDARIAQAEQMEKAGHREVANAILEQPIAAPVYVAPKFEKGSLTRKHYKAVVFDVIALAKAVVEGKAQIGFIEPNQTALNTMARALGEQMNVPGVKVEVERY